MDMEMQFPGDRRDARVRSRRNVGELERLGIRGGRDGSDAVRPEPAAPGGMALAIMGATAGQARRDRPLRAIDEALDLNTASTAGDTRRALGGRAGSQVHEAITVNRPASELYRFWRTLENLPRFMQHVTSVERVSETVSRWRARGPRNAVVEWQAEIINDVPNELIAWRSLDGSDIVSAGSVHFADAGADRGTTIRVKLQYSPPGGRSERRWRGCSGRTPPSQIREDLRRFKQLLEAGEIATDGTCALTAASPS